MLDICIVLTQLQAAFFLQDSEISQNSAKTEFSENCQNYEIFLSYTKTSLCVVTGSEEVRKCVVTGSATPSKSLFL